MIFKKEDINGSIVKSFVTCERQGALVLRKISPLLQDSNIQMGAVYAKMRSESRCFGGIEVDGLDKRGNIVVIEYKKTFSNIVASRMQLLFYMHTMKNEVKCKNIEGYVISEESNEKLHVRLDCESTLEVEDMITSIMILADGKIPKYEYKDICENCAFYLYCSS